MAARTTDPDASLKRLGGGRWQTRDERFTIEPQSGTWVVVDAEATDELGLPLVRGPFGSLGAAKSAIAEARSGAPPASPLAGRGTAAGAEAAPEPPRSRRSRRKATAPERPPGPVEPRWLRELGSDDRRRASRLMAALEEAGVADPEGLVRRDLVGDVPAVAAWAVGSAMAALGDDAHPAAVARLLADGRDDRLAVRWRLVDADGRPVTLELDDA